MNKLKTIWLLLTSSGYILMCERGVASCLPLEVAPLENIQDEVGKFDVWLEELINELILEERLN